MNRPKKPGYYWAYFEKDGWDIVEVYKDNNGELRYGFTLCDYDYPITDKVIIKWSRKIRKPVIKDKE